MIKIDSHRGKYEVKDIDINNFLKKKLNKNTIYIIDINILKLYPKIKFYLKDKKKIEIIANEKSKDFKNIIKYLKILSEFNINKSFELCAIGGGVVQDIVCFLASIYFRGLNWIFIPTTLEAQGDSCIGSKSSINFRGKKNQIGTFYPPKKILIDKNFLNTLNKDLVLSGLGEMLHYFAFSKKDFLFYKKNYLRAQKNFTVLKKLISKSLKIKKEFVEIDEFDNKKRKLLNFGHTFAHAIEAYTKYQIPHGIAVAHGIDIANFISLKKKIIKKDQFKDYQVVIKNLTKNYPLNKINTRKFIEIIKSDKKVLGDKISLILMNKKNISIYSQKFDQRFNDMISEYFIKK